MKKISAKDFLEAFTSEWTVQIEKDKAGVLEQYSRESTLTSFMLSSDGFLSKAMQRLKHLEPSLKYIGEFDKIDAVYVGGEDLFRSDLYYPSQLHVLIEHENGEWVEEEMWKLVHWRSPLKVLIFYDWNEDEKTTDKRRKWLEEKLEKLQEMSQKVDKFFTENDETEYLYIIGNREESDGDVQWRCATKSALKLTRFAGG